MSEADFEILGNRWYIELLCEIDPDGSRFTDLEEELGLATDTLSERLRKLTGLGLLDHVAQTGGRGTTAPYKLSPKGATFRRALHESGTVLLYRQLKAAQREFDGKKEEMADWAENELPKFDEEHHEGNLELLLGDADLYADESVLPDVTQDEE